MKDGVRSLLLVAVSVALGHQLVYLLRYGLGPDLAAATSQHGHAFSLPAMAAAAVLSAIAFGAIVVWRVVGLRRALRQSRVSPQSLMRDRAGSGFGVRWMRSSSRVGSGTIVMYLLVENGEHVLAHGHFEGLSVLAAGNPVLTLSALIVTAAVVSLVALMLRWPEVVLEARLAASRGQAQWRRASATERLAWNASAATARWRWIIARRILGRAPPLRATV